MARKKTTEPRRRLNPTSIGTSKAQMNAGLLTDGLKKRAGNESFWRIGQPDVRLERIAVKIVDARGIESLKVMVMEEQT